MARKFTADFETTTDINDCRVWAYAICEIGNPENFIYGNSIEDFIKWCSKKDENYILYFHNLKFDSEFIFSYLLQNGYTFIKDKKDRKDKTFTATISDFGQIYNAEIYFDTHNKRHINKVTICDSLKVLNFSVEQIAKDFDLPIRKLELDYNEIREIGHELTPHEIDYIRNDVEIMARALEILFDNQLNKITIASNALASYKELNKNFDTYFPKLEFIEDQEIRKSYRGGFTYLNPIYKDVLVGSGLVLDVNSLYPSVMKYERLPYGKPEYFQGQYKEDKLYPLYVQTFTCSFELKEGFIPTIQIKNNMSFVPNEYLESSNGDIVTLTMSNIDLELFFKHYNVYDITYDSGYKFRCLTGLFTNYIDKWSESKIEAKKEKNGAMYLISKLMLNSLYGKFGLNPKVRSKSVALSEDDIVIYPMNEEEIRDALYIPVATFITAYARRKTITTSQKIKEYSKNKYGKDLYVYSDTDSIHCLFDTELDENKNIILKNDKELYDILDIDDYKLGFWKLESVFTKAKFLRQKCYIEQNNDKLNTTIAGLPKRLSNIINFDNFKEGFTTMGMELDKPKLMYKHVKGGIVLVRNDFSIKK